MFSFFKKDKVILSLKINHKLALEIKSKDIPFNRDFKVELGPQAIIELIDTEGNKTSYTNSALSGETIFNLRIHPNFACQLDCTISSLGSDGKVEINDKGVEGIRFQPIYLPQNKEMFNKDWRGNGLFERGLHYSGYSTPGNVTLCGICDDCKKSFHFKSINTGFSDHSYSYSESGLYTRLVARGESEEAVPKIAPDKTSFSPLNSFCCPHCGSDYISFENQDKKSIERYANIHSGLTPLTSS